MMKLISGFNPTLQQRQGNAFIRFQGLGVELPIQDAFEKQELGQPWLADEHRLTEIGKLNKHVETSLKLQFDQPWKNHNRYKEGVTTVQSFGRGSSFLEPGNYDDQILYLYSKELTHNDTVKPQAAMHKEVSFLADLLKGLKRQLKQVPGALSEKTKQPVIQIGIEHRIPASTKVNSYLNAIGSNRLWDFIKENGMEIRFASTTSDRFPFNGSLKSLNQKRIDTIGRLIEIGHYDKKPMTVSEILGVSESMVRNMVRHSKP